MKKLLTDTDFLPQVKNIQIDLYRLLYGVLVNRSEGRIYDIIITLCKGHTEAPLRFAKIEYWISNVKQVIDVLSQYENDSNYEVYVPYLGLRCDVQKLVQLYSFALCVLEQVKGLKYSDLTRKNNSTLDSIRYFFPTAGIDTLMRESIPMLCKQYPDILPSMISKAIDRELYRRGFSSDAESSSFQGEDLYNNLFLNAAKVPLLPHTIEVENNEEYEYDNKTSLLKQVGIIYFMIEDYTNNLRKWNKDCWEREMNTLVRKIVSGLVEPNKPFNSGDMASTTAYQYVHGMKFCNKRTNIAVIEHLCRVLKNYKIPFPAKLREEAERRRLNHLLK